ncbi:MAG: glycerophosphodiester phosphodiesterase family protein [Gammaproteobacteria bacterium]|jgi:glycerophosphoryl diester phosphodiesterase
MHLPKVIAHRGASQIAPENTLIAFKKAQELGATWVEFDVMLTQDNIAIIHHDDTFKRILDLDQNVHQTPFSQIKHFHDRIPTLIEALSCCADLDLSLNIELKTTKEFAHQTALMTLDILNLFKFYQPENILFSSQEMEALKIIYTASPAYRLGLVADNWDDVEHALQQDIPMYALSLHYPILTVDKVKEMLDRGLEVLAFTVNDQKLAFELFDRGVCSVFSDNPRLLLNGDTQN